MRLIVTDDCLHIFDNGSDYLKIEDELKLQSRFILKNLKSRDKHQLSEKIYRLLEFCKHSREIEQIKDKFDEKDIQYSISQGWLKESHVKKESCAEFYKNKDGVFPSYPNFVTLNITNNCNLKCTHCINSQLEFNNEYLDFGVIKRFIKELKYYCVGAVQLSGGEPMMHPNISEILELFEEEPMNVVLFTNLSYSNENYINKLISAKSKLGSFLKIHVSIDGIGNHHDLIRGNGQFNNVMCNIKKLYENGVYIDSIETMATKNLVHDIKELMILCNKYSIKDLNIHPIYAFVSNLPEYLLLDYKERVHLYNLVLDNLSSSGNININYNDYLMPIILENEQKVNLLKREKVEKFLSNLMAHSENIKLKLKSSGRKNCGAGITKLFISAEGDAYPCLLYAGSNKDYCGNIYSDKISDIWNSEGMKRVRTPINNSNLEHCEKCTYEKECGNDCKKCRVLIEKVSGDFWGKSPYCL